MKILDQTQTQALCAIIESHPDCLLVDVTGTGRELASMLAEAGVHLGNVVGNGQTYLRLTTPHEVVCEVPKREAAYMELIKQRGQS